MIVTVAGKGNFVESIIVQLTLSRAVFMLSWCTSFSCGETTSHTLNPRPWIIIKQNHNNAKTAPGDEWAKNKISTVRSVHWYNAVHWTRVQTL